MKRKNISQDEFRLEKHHMERPTGKSQTVPDETLSIREIMQKHVRGQKISDELMRTPIYDEGANYDSEDLEKLRDSDLFDQEEIRNLHKQNIEENKQKQKNFFNKNKKEEEAKRQGEPRSPTEEPENSPDKPTKKPTKEAPKEDKPEV